MKGRTADWRSVGSDRAPADDLRFGLVPTHPGGVEVTLQSQERPDRHPDVVARRVTGSRLASFHPAALLQAPVIVLDRPGLFGQAPAASLSIARSSVAQYSVSPSRETILKTRIRP